MIVRVEVLNMGPVYWQSWGGLTLVYQASIRNPSWVSERTIELKCTIVVEQYKNIYRKDYT